MPFARKPVILYLVGKPLEWQKWNVNFKEAQQLDNPKVEKYALLAVAAMDKAEMIHDFHQKSTTPGKKGRGKGNWDGNRKATKQVKIYLDKLRRGEPKSCTHL